MKKDRQIKKIFIGLLGVLFLLSAVGCGGKRYLLELNNRSLISSKTFYKEGETVTIYYDGKSAPEYGYRFFVDAENIELKDGEVGSHRYAVSFTMPAKSVTVNVEEIDGKIKNREMKQNEFEVWICKECGYDHNKYDYCAKCGRKKPWK